MKSLSLSTSVKIFLTFLLVFGLFAHWTGWNEESRLALTRSIVERQSLDINPYANYTGDRAVFEGDYYSDKAPGSSFVKVPVYFLWDQVSGEYPEEELFLEEEYGPRNTTIYLRQDPSFKLSMARFLSIFFISALPGALLVVLIYKVASLFTGTNKALLTSFLFGLGTTIFAYSTVYMGAVTASLFPFLSFFLLIKAKRENLGNKYYFFSGLFLSLSVFFEYYTAIVLIAFFTGLVLTYLWKILQGEFPGGFFENLLENKQYLLYFILGVGIGALPLLLYNLAAFGGPLSFSSFHVDREVWPEPFGSLSPGNIPYILPRITFSPYRGLFFYSPLLLISAGGFYFLWKRKKGLFLYILLLFLCFLFFNSLYIFWHGGASFGPRYLTPMVPFLAVPFALVLDRFEKNKIFAMILILLASISVFHCFLAFNSWEGPDLDQHDELRSAGPFENPLYDHYLPEFKEHGPRSQILSGIVTGELDLAFIEGYPETVAITSIPVGILVLRISFLSLSLALLIFVLFWYKEIFGALETYISKIPNFALMALILAAVLILPLLTVTDTHFQNNWQLRGENETGRWMSQNGTILFYRKKPEAVGLNLSTGTYREPRNMSVFFNGELVWKETVESVNENIHIPGLNFEKGANVLKLSSEQGCDIPVEFDQEDSRCLSFRVENITEFSRKDENLFFVSGFYDEEKMEDGNRTFRWMGPRGEVYFWTNHTAMRPAVTGWSYSEDAPLEMLLKEKKLASYSFTEERKRFQFPIVLPEAEVKMEIVSLRGCERPSPGERCLSIALSNFTQTEDENLLRLVDTEDEGWHGPEVWGKKTARWISDEASLNIFNSQGEGRKLGMSVTSYYRNRTLKVSKNRKRVVVKEINENGFTDLSIPLDQGKNRIRFEAKEGCDRPLELEGKEDSRCLSFGFKEMEVS
ncbi:MAG: glycosyltransferase family 39 protein [Candidatus Aenigmatarchaeota archaeon]